MQGLQGFTLILLMQALGEGLVRLLHLPLPGPVIGLLLLLLALYWPPLRQPVQVCADFLLSHLALLFVPISVGVVSQLPLLQQYGGRIALVLVLSTAVGLGVTALALRALMRPHTPPSTLPSASPEHRHE
ncbi:MAG: CidA/LrgA family protein [Pseudomonadota bacterium]|nr:CidA/LrgA family protein [Pseudomonadota bacterium]